MAFDREKLYHQATQIATLQNCYFIEQLISLLPCSKPTFYDIFKIDSNELNSIKDILEQNKIATKTKMYKKWFDSENATLQIGLMKLISTEEEAHRLNGTKSAVDVTSKGDKVGNSVENIREAFGLNNLKNPMDEPNE